MKAQRIFLFVTLGALALARPVSAGELTNVVETSHLAGGVILLVNASSAIYDDAAATAYTVRGLETDPAVVESLRKRFLARRTYGKLSVTGFDGKTLPCIDSLANVVVTSGECQVAIGEWMHRSPQIQHFVVPLYRMVADARLYGGFGLPTSQ